MPHMYRAHSAKFRHREFWLPHESPGTYNKMNILILSLICVIILLLYVIIQNRDTTEYATRKQVNKIETHLFQLEERLVWTDEKIDSMQAMAEAVVIKQTEDIVEPEPEPEPEPDSVDKSTFVTSSENQGIPEVSTEPPEKIIEQVSKVEAPQEKTPAEIPVLQPKIKKKKIKRKDFGIIYKYHKVRQGETLYRIGLKYSVSVSEIRRLNHLGPNDSIHTGQRLLVSQGSR